MGADESTWKVNSGKLNVLGIGRKIATMKEIEKEQWETGRKTRRARYQRGQGYSL